MWLISPPGTAAGSCGGLAAGSCSTREESSGDLIHDDLIISAAVTALLKDQEWGIGESSIVIANDPLSGLGDVF